MIKKHIVKILFFITNLSLAVLGVCFLKNQDDEKSKSQNKDEFEIIPVSQEVMDAQNKIATDRENKLRDLNSSPKEIKKQDAQTTTTTTTTTKKPKSDAKTKTS